MHVEKSMRPKADAFRKSVNQLTFSFIDFNEGNYKLNERVLYKILQTLEG